MKQYEAIFWNNLDTASLKLLEQKHITILEWCDIVVFYSTVWVASLSLPLFY